MIAFLIAGVVAIVLTFIAVVCCRAAGLDEARNHRIND